MRELTVAELKIPSGGAAAPVTQTCQVDGDKDNSVMVCVQSNGNSTITSKNTVIVEAEGGISGALKWVAGVEAKGGYKETTTVVTTCNAKMECKTADPIVTREQLKHSDTNDGSEFENLASTWEGDGGLELAGDGGSEGGAGGTSAIEDGGGSDGDGDIEDEDLIERRASTC